MSYLSRLFSLWRNLFDKTRVEQELADEVRAYLEMLTEAKIKEGLSLEEARRAALIEIGGLEQVKERVREARLGSYLETLGRDLRYGIRVFAKNPGFTAVAVITLALGIGANTAIFSVINAVLLRPLPYAEAGRLVAISGALRDRTNEAGVTPADFLDYQAQSRSFEQFAASISDTIPMNLTGDGNPERIQGAVVTTNYLDVFGVKPALGRTFDSEVEGDKQVVVLSHGLWERRFGADPSIVNKTVTLDGSSYTVIGVLPQTFNYPANAEVWTPVAFVGPPQSPLRSRELHFLRVVGKLKPEVTIAQAQAESDAIAAQLAEQYPKTNTGWSLHFVALQESIVGNIGLTLLVLFGAVGCVLAIACANVANLLLARASSRQKEMALRLALGAGPWRVVRQMMTESLLLALCGGVCGVTLAKWGVSLLVALAGADLPRATEISMDTRVLAFMCAVSLLTGLLFGLAPALQSARLDLHDALKEGGRSGGVSARRNRARNLLVVSESALAVVLLIGAGLLIKSLVKLQDVSPGFDEKNLLTARIDLPQAYKDLEKKANFWMQLQQRMATLPGVEAVGMVSELPLSRQSSDLQFSIEGRPEQNTDESGSADFRNINQDYFRVMQIPLLRGRFFTEREVQESADVVVISDELARRYFPDEDPIGKRLYIKVLNKRSFEIIGVVGDVRHRGLDVELRQTLYFPTLQTGWFNLVIRTANNPAALATAVRKEVAAIDPNQPVADIKTMEQWVSESVARPRFRALLLGIFSAVALSLAVVGMYGVVSYGVSQRTREIGIRMALGAQDSDVLKLVVGQGIGLAAAGAAVGLAAAWALTRFLRSLLFEVSTTDPVTFVVIAGLLITSALLACYLPARRATKVDPIIALRYE